MDGSEGELNPDLIITRAHVFTADPAAPRAEAVAVGGSRLTFVGSAAEAESLRGPRTRLIDAKGRSLLPGLIDSHFHLLWGSVGLADAQLGSVRTLDDLSSALRKFADDHPSADWLTGSGLPYNFLPGGLPLSRHHLDAIIADRPIFVLAYDHHTVWANTEALRRANLLRDGATTGPNSEIVIGSDGLASGELREFGAYDSIKALIPKPDTAAKRSLLHQGLAQAAALGITGIHNMNGDAEELALYAALEDAGELTLRIYCPYLVTPETPAEALAEAAALRDEYPSDPLAGSGRGMVRGGAVKFFMDGVIESGTALLLDDYADRP
ncbi:MAG: amidohydrolase family protein, partial [Chloroflexota bacterium]